MNYLNTKLIVEKLFRSYFCEGSIKDVCNCVTEEIVWYGSRWPEPIKDRIQLEGRLDVSCKNWELVFPRLEVAALDRDFEQAYGELELSCWDDSGETKEIWQFAVICRLDDGVWKACSVHLFQWLPEGNGIEQQRQKNMVAELTLDLFQDSVAGGMMGGYLESGYPLYYINDKMLSYLGYTYDGFILETGGMIDQCIHPDDLPGVISAVEEAINKSEEYQVQYRMRKRDGTYLWVMDRGKKTISWDGRPALISVCIDVTEQIQLRHELRQFYQTVVSGIAKVVVEPECRLRFVNDQFCQLLGYSQAEFQSRIGKSGLDLIFAEDRDHIKSLIDERAPNNRCSTRFRLLRKDGSAVWVQMESSLSDELWEEKRLAYCMFTDIDSQRAQELQNQRSQQYMSMILSNFVGGTMITSLDQRWPFIFVGDNLLQFLGYQREEFDEISGGCAGGLIFSEDLPGVEEEVSLQLGFNDYYEIEYRMVRRDGTLVWVLEEGHKTDAGDGQPVLVCLLLDNTERKKLETNLVMEKERYRIITELSDSILWEYDCLQGHTPDFRFAEISAECRSQLADYFDRCRSGQGSLSMEFQAKIDSAADQHWYRIEGALVRDRTGNVVKAVGKLTDIEDEKQKALQLQIATQRDSMTGMYNKAYTQKAVDSALQRIAAGKTAALMIIDIDHFKNINDMLGHLFGDSVLISVSQTLRDFLPADTVYGRIGGDEFVALLPSVTPEQAVKTAEELCRRISKVYVGELKEMKISCSIGISEFPRQGENYVELFRKADEALFSAKQSGKNKAVFHDTGVSASRTEERLLNIYSMDETLSLDSGSEEHARFLSWMTELLSTTRDLDSAVQLILGRICLNYQVDSLYIAEYCVDQAVLKMTYLRSTGVKEPFFHRNDLLDQTDWDFLQMDGWNKEYLQNSDFQNIDKLMVSGHYRRILEEYAVLLIPVIHNREPIGFLLAAREGNYGGWPGEQIGLFRQIGEILTPYLLKKQNEERAIYEMNLALNYDSLTGLPVLAYFKKQVQEILNQDPESRYVMVYSDINNFKFINDTYGFMVGDQVLCAFADMMRADTEFRNVCCCRISNDNFLAMIPFDDMEELKFQVEDCNQQVKDTIRQRYPGMDIFVNTGISEVLREEDGILKAIDNANIARKSRKGMAKNSCRIFDETMKRRMAIEAEMANSMNAALENGEFKVYLQPKVNLEDGSVVGAEALVRWQRPQGMIFPDYFIPFFERNGFVTKVDEYMFIQVLKMLRRWLETYGYAVPVSINLSRLHGDNPDKVMEIINLTEEYQIPPSLLEFELTETAFYEDANRIKHMLVELMDNGYGVSIDDFGSGYSSLNTISSIPASVIKLDKGFLQKDGERAYNKIVVKHVIAMAKEMGYHILCEGVETEKQVAFLKTMGCEIAQGYFYSKPIPVEEFEQKFLK